MQKLFVLGLIQILLLTCLSAFADKQGGNSGAGGGSGLATRNGQVYFVDLIDQNQLSSIANIAQPDAQVINAFYAPNRYVSILAKADANFFSCAVHVLGQHRQQVKSVDALLPELGHVDVLQVKFPIKNISEIDLNSLGKIILPMISSASNQFAPEIQSTLAAYAGNQVWISEQLYGRLSQRDQCGLSVHEALRHLNFMNRLVETLTQDEIEVLTRYFMNASYTFDNPNRALAKLGNLNDFLTPDEFRTSRDRLVERLQTNLTELTRTEYSASSTSRYAVLNAEVNQISEAMKNLALRSLRSVDMTIGSRMAQVNNLGIIGTVTLKEILTTPQRHGKKWDVLHISK